MASSLVFTIESELSAAELAKRLQKESHEAHEGVIEAYKFLREVAGRLHRAEVAVRTSSTLPLAASGTFTLDTVIATDQILIGSITLTGSDTPSTEAQFDTSLATDALIAADIAEVINAHSVLSTIVKASAAAEVVTVQALAAGVLGNQLTISSPDTTITASGARLTGGAGGDQGGETVYSLL